MNIDPIDYPNLRIDGPVSVSQIATEASRQRAPLLIVGPTGAGKSAFIEALAQDASLCISSNQLEGFTQTINTYHVKSITPTYFTFSPGGTYLVDVPGFADTKISTTSIVSMLEKWIRESKAVNLGRILYFTPIHSVRLPGSHREVLRTFQALTGSSSATNITIVTTMWDNLWGDGAKNRAESNFNQLQDAVWKEFIDEGSQIVKFHNTQQSALSILNTAYRELGQAEFHLEVHLKGKTGLKNALFANQLMSDLQNRIQNLEIERATTNTDLKAASERCDDLLISTLVPKLKEVEMLLEKFERELYDNFGLVVTPSAVIANVDNPITTAKPSEAGVPPAALLPPAGALETPIQPPLSQTLRPSDSSSHHTEAIAPPTGATVVALEPIPPKRRLLAGVIRSVKCWGDAIAEHHDA